MTDKTDQTDQTDQTAQPQPSAAVASARQALEMKRAAAAAGGPSFKPGRVGDERAAAARSASRSKPALRK